MVQTLTSTPLNTYDELECTNPLCLTAVPDLTNVFVAE